MSKRNVPIKCCPTDQTLKVPYMTMICVLCENVSRHVGSGEYYESELQDSIQFIRLHTMHLISKAFASKYKFWPARIACLKV